MDALSKLTILFTLALTFSLVIERTVEVFKAFYDLLDSHFNWCNFWTSQTKKIQQRVNERLKNMEFLDPSLLAGLIYKLDVMLVSNQNDSNHTIPVLSGDLVRAAFIKVAAKGFGIILGITVALTFHLNFLMILGEEYKPLGNALFQTILSGIAIGFGSAPVHKLILSMEKRREKRMSAAGGAQ